MGLPRGTVERVAKVARLELSEEEVERLRAELDAILEAFNALQSEPLPDAGDPVPDPLPVPLSGEPRPDVPETWPEADRLFDGSRMSRGLMRGPRLR